MPYRFILRSLPLLPMSGFSLLLVALVACGGQNTGQTERIQNAGQIAHGKTLFDQYCASCHGENAVGTPDWRKRDSNGNFPPPPLNGTAHAWHHPTAQLHHTIKEGGPVGLSNMPGFKAQLSDSEIDAIIEYIKSLWPDKIYAAWYEREQQALNYLQQQQQGN